MKIKRLSRPYRYRIEDVAGEPLRCVRAGWEMTFSEFDFARGIAMLRSTQARPLVVRDLETGKVMDVEQLYDFEGLKRVVGVDDLHPAMTL